MASIYDERDKERIARESLDDIRIEAGRLYRSLGNVLCFLRQARTSELAELAEKVERQVRDFNNLVERRRKDVRHALEP